MDEETLAGIGNIFNPIGAVEELQAESTIDAVNAGRKAINPKAKAYASAGNKKPLKPIQQIKKQQAINRALDNTEANPIAEAVVRSAIGGYNPYEDEGIDVAPTIDADAMMSEAQTTNLDDMTAGLNRVVRQAKGQIINDRAWKPGYNAEDELNASMYSLTHFGRDGTAFADAVKAEQAEHNARVARAKESLAPEMSYPEYLFQKLKQSGYDSATGLAKLMIENDIPLDAIGLGDVQRDVNDAMLNGIEAIRQDVDQHAFGRVNYDTELGKQFGEGFANIAPSLMMSGLSATTGGVAPLFASETGSAYNQLRDKGVDKDLAVLGAVASGGIEAGTEKLFGINDLFKSLGNIATTKTGTAMLKQGGNALLGLTAAEYPGEGMATIGQSSIQGILDPKGNPTNIYGDLEDTFKQTTAQGAVTAIPGLLGVGLGHGLARRRANQIAQQTQTQENSGQNASTSLEEQANKIFNEPTVDAQGNVSFQGKQTDNQKHTLMKQHQSGGAVEYDNDGNITKITPQKNVVNQNPQNLIDNNVSQSNVRDNRQSTAENKSIKISDDDEEVKLTDHQREIARTSNFKRWFGFDWERNQETTQGELGDDSSRMDRQMDSIQYLRAQIYDAESRGNNGRARSLRAELGKNLGRLNLLNPKTNEPRLFYHGTKDDFSTFDLDHKNKKDAGNIGSGIYLAANPADASRYGQNKQKGEASLNVMPLFVSMKNPYIMDATNKASNLSKESASKITERLKAEGHDGIIAFNFNMPDWQDEPSMAVAFYPSQVKSAIGNNGDFDSNNDNILFSKSDKKNKGMSAEQVRQAISSDKANESVVVVQSKEELPAHLQGKVDDNTDGLYDPKTNKAYLIANNISSEEQAQKKAGHEVIAHYGMENMLGEEEMDKLCDRVTNALQKGNKTLQKYSNAVNKTQPGLSNRIHAREIIAEMLENGEENMITKRVIDAIKRFLNRLGFKFDLTTADIRKALRDARKYVRQGKSNAKNVTKQEMFSKKIGNRESNDYDTHHFSYLEDTGDGLFAVQTEMWTNPTITFGELKTLAHENNGNYSWKDTQDEYGGIGRFVFESEEDAVNFQDEIEKLGNEKWGDNKTPKEEKIAQEEENAKANKEELEKRKQERESGTPREQVRHGRNWVASEKKEANPLIGKTNRELIDWLGTEKEEIIRQWGGDELVEKLQALKDKQDTQEKARQEAVGEWVDEDGVVHTKAENTPINNLNESKQEEEKEDDYDGERLDPEKNPPYEPPYRTDDSPIEKKEPTTDGKSANPVQQEEWVDEDGVVHVGKNPNDLDAHQKMVRDSIGAAKYEEMQQKLIAKYNEAKQAIAEKGSEATEDDFRRLNEARNICKAWGVTEDTLDGKFENTQKDARERRKEWLEKRRQAREEQTEKQEKNTETTEEKGDASWQSADENDQPRSKTEEKGQESEEESESNEPPSTPPENNSPDPIQPEDPNRNAFETPHQTGLRKWWDDFIRAIQDRMIDLKRIQDAIIKAAGYELDDNGNPYLAEEAYQSRLQEQHRKIREEYMIPIIRLLKKTGLTSDQVSRWLYARHVLLDNVNSKLYARNGEKDASGMSDALAKRIYEEHKNNADMQAIGKLMDDMHNNILQQQVDFGMIDRATYKKLTNAYKHYVPFKDIDEDFTHHTGTGFNLLGKEQKYREGRKEEATANVLAQAFINAENAVRRIEKTRVTRAFLKMVQKYGNDTLWKDEVPQNGNQNVPDNVLVIRDEKAVDHWVTFNKADPMAMRVCESLRNLDVQELPSVMKMFTALNNYMGKWMTSKNPGFILRNLFRDVQGALFNLTDTPLNGKQHQVLKNLPHAWKALRNFIKQGTFADKDGVVTQYDKYCQEFIDNGGKTNFVDMENTVVGRAKQIEKMLEMLNDDGTDKAGLFKSIGKVIEDTNAIAENAVRLSTFITARENGLSIAKAVSLAKNVSVNFGRRGTSTSFISAMYLFGNASIQGTARLVSAVAKSKTARAVSGAMIGAGFLNRMLVQMVFGALNSGLDDDDPRISQFEKDNYWIIPYKFNTDVPDDFIKIPLPHGLRVFHMLGGYIADLCFNHKAQKNWATYGMNTVINMVNDFTPVGNGSITQSFLPTFAQPIAGAFENTSGLGGEIVQQGQPNDPAYKNARWGTPKHYTWLSQLMNKITGGDDFNKGKVQIQPNMLQHLIESYVAPGPMTDIDRALGAVEKVIDRMFNDNRNERQRKEDELTSKDIPFIGGFHGSPWHKWESYKDVQFEDNNDKEEIERSKHKVRQGWGYDYKYHKEVGAVLQDMADGKIPYDEERRDNGKNVEGRKAEVLNGNAEILDGVIRVIDSANKTLYISTYEMSQPDIVKHLMMAKDRGVDVRIVVDHRQNHDKNSEIALQLLKNKGIDVNETQAWSIMHDKTIVADRITLMTGSFNFSENAVMNNKENIRIGWGEKDGAEKSLRDDFSLTYHASHEWNANGRYDKESGKAPKAPTKMEINAAKAFGEDTTEMERVSNTERYNRRMDRYNRKQELDSLNNRPHKMTKGERLDRKLSELYDRL